jgi:hypothetical protein
MICSIQVLRANFLAILTAMEDGIAIFHISYVNKSQQGCHAIEWANDELTLLQVFLGPIEGGHWTLVVVDGNVKTIMS